jgi:hypothetical protein
MSDSLTVEDRYHTREALSPDVRSLRSSVTVTCIAGCFWSAPGPTEMKTGPLVSTWMRCSAESVGPLPATSRPESCTMLSLPSARSRTSVNHVSCLAPDMPTAVQSV